MNAAISCSIFALSHTMFSNNCRFCLFDLYDYCGQSIIKGDEILITIFNRLFLTGMSKQCWATIVTVFIMLLYLFELAISIFVVPIDGQCDWNSNIPDNPAFNISMQDWIMLNMVTAIFVLAVFCSGTRSDANSDCVVALLVTIFTIANIFIFAWSIVGIILYNDYYGEACSSVDSYETILELGLYTDLVVSSIIILFLIFLGITLCMDQGSNIERRRLVGHPEMPYNQQPQQIIIQEVSGQKQSDMVTGGSENREQKSILTDEQFEKKQNVYHRIYDRMIGGHRSRDLH